MNKKKKRPYVVTTSLAHGERGASTAFTREGIMLEVAMRLVSNGEITTTAWKKAQQFVREMDKRLPFEEPVPMTNDDSLERSNR